MNEQEILFIDATPDNDYPIRILEAYRAQCDSKWSNTSNWSGDEEIDGLMKTMNDAQNKRTDILNKAIAILRERMSKPYWIGIPESNSDTQTITAKPIEGIISSFWSDATDEEEALIQACAAHDFLESEKDQEAYYDF